MTLFHQVAAAKREWAAYGSEGTIFGSINRSQLEAVEVPEVDDEFAGQAERELEALESRLMAAVSENERLAVTREELLPLLMSGRLRVKDAEKVVEGAV